MVKRSDHRPHVPAIGAEEPQPTGLLARFSYDIFKFWKGRVSIIVPLDTYRDHLALERTFLSHLRTSRALSMMGITVAQIFRLQHSPTPDARFGDYVLGKPLSYICQGPAICTLLNGAFRTRRTQNALVRSKSISGGFEITLLSTGIFLVLATFFVLIVVDIGNGG